MNRFGYLQDRLCVMSLAAYAVNHLLVVPYWGGVVRAHAPWAWPFLHSHFDDLLLMPAALPVVLWLQRLMGLRSHDQPPGWVEMFLHLGIWSVMCKIVGPWYLHVGVADPWDVLFFTAGGVVAVMWWRRPAPQTCPAHEL
jgi:hypothetical protein